MRYLIAPESAVQRVTADSKSDAFDKADTDDGVKYYIIQNPDASIFSIEKESDLEVVG